MMLCFAKPCAKWDAVPFLLSSPPAYTQCLRDLFLGIIGMNPCVFHFCTNLYGSAAFSASIYKRDGFLSIPCLWQGWFLASKFFSMGKIRRLWFENKFFGFEIEQWKVFCCLWRKRNFCIISFLLTHTFSRNQFGKRACT